MTDITAYTVSVALNEYSGSRLHRPNCKKVARVVPIAELERGKDYALKTASCCKLKDAVVDEATAYLAEAPVADETPAVEASKGLTRKQAVAALKGLGYTGPTSYLMPKLRAIVAEQITIARQARGVE